MNLATHNFISICGMAGLEEKQAQETWLTLYRQTIKDFLLWLANEAHLKDTELRQLYQHLKATLLTKNNQKNILELLIPLLPPAQQTIAMEKFSHLFLDHLQAKYQELESKMTWAQKQVFKSYLQAYKD